MKNKNNEPVKLFEKNNLTKRESSDLKRKQKETSTNF